MFILSVVLLFMWIMLSVITLFLCNLDMVIISFKTIFSSLGMDLEILISIWNLFFMMLVLLISLCVLFFSISYMTLLSVKMFMYLYLSFVFSMCWLILNNNFYWMMLGWDGLGVVSFLLIMFYQNYESNTNALFTLFQNRIGDLFFVFFLVLMLNFSMVSTLSIVSYSLLVLIIGAVVKSAQFPFNAWLLAAMSAPTPISSLVHSSTLVVAGVYILLQYSYCLMNYMLILKFMSLSTLIVSLFGLMVESDMKKLIANSTMSHVGLMLFLMSEGLFKISFFHLNVHAMFKSMMFMCFGFVMLTSYHSQDYRLISFFNLMPIVKFTYMYACMCLMGLPFLSAFFSKDFILEKWVEWSVEFSFFFMLLSFMGVSVYYSMKLLSLKDFFYVWVSKESFSLGGMSVILIMFVSVVLINILISYVFSVSLELMPLKFMIYLFMLIYLFMKIISTFFYKWLLYEKTVLMSELFSICYFSVESYAYSVLNEIVKLSSSSSLMLKNILLINWWVIIILVCLV